MGFKTATNYNSQHFGHIMFSICFFSVLLMCNPLLFPLQYSESSPPQVHTVKDRISNYLADLESEQVYQSNKCIDDALCNNSALMKQLGKGKTITDGKLLSNLSIIQSNECSDQQICVNDAKILDYAFLSKDSQNIIQHCDTSSGPTCLNVNHGRVDTEALSKAMLEYVEDEDSQKTNNKNNNNN